MIRRTMGKTITVAKPRGKPSLRLEWIAAGSLSANPRNWRRHPPEQLGALRHVLGDPDVGWAGALLYNERTKRLIDGHARREVVDPDTPVPVLIGSWSEEAERKILATLDPLAAFAQADALALTALLAETDLSAPDLAGLETMLRGLATPAGELLPPEGGGGDTSPKLAGLEYRIVIECTGERQQAELLARFAKQRLTCKALIS